MVGRLATGITSEDVIDCGETHIGTDTQRFTISADTPRQDLGIRQHERTRLSADANEREGAMSGTGKSEPSGVTSREYKLILVPDRFADRRGGAAALRDLVHLFAERNGAKVEDQGGEELRRTHYLDTKAHHLRDAGFALRVRFEDDQGQYKVSLKHRTSDRYLAASKNVRSAKPKDDDPKFEEDILPPFRSVFSRSNSRWFDELPKLKDIGDAVQLFPGLSALEAPKEAELETVNSFEAHEVFRKLCKVKFKKGRKAKVGLSFWYHTPEDRWPLIAECAFDYDTDDGDEFPIPVVEGANQLFGFLQNQPGWFNFDATTKTKYVYEGLS